VRIVRHFPVPPAMVWRSWTDPDVIRLWFGSDPAGRVTSAHADVRPGGDFAVSFTDSDQTAHTCSGVYSDVQPDTRLVFSWRWQSEPDWESCVTVEFKPDRGGTEMRFEHAQLGRGSQHGYLAGWQRTFEKLARVLATLA
jgi:uncharacterized protein YndB with AHSA1/START domain